MPAPARWPLASLFAGGDFRPEGTALPAVSGVGQGGGVRASQQVCQALQL